MKGNRLPDALADGDGDPAQSVLDQALAQLCNKDRIIELMHDFILFDMGVKKTCRHNQYFGIKAAQAYVKRREGGIIWHTQGSGKSLTMVWLAKWIRENIPGSRVLLITDRTELDEQIEGVFHGVGEPIYRTKSGADLIAKLNDTIPPLICSLVHKFGGKEDDDSAADDFIAELKKAIPSDFAPKGDLYVFVDECHRTQSGKLHSAMKAILPDALFLGFTGTPLLKKDKQTSMEVFGPFIHTYRYDEGVRDGVVLDLLYEARDIDQDITSPEKIDTWFDAKTAVRGCDPARRRNALGMDQSAAAKLQGAGSTGREAVCLRRDALFPWSRLSAASDQRGGVLSGSPWRLEQDRIACPG